MAQNKVYVTDVVGRLNKYFFCKLMTVNKEHTTKVAILIRKYQQIHNKYTLYVIFFCYPISFTTT